MTTDTKEKEVAVKFTCADGTEVTIGGMAKGSGMIHPNMCTMLCLYYNRCEDYKEGFDRKL